MMIRVSLGHVNPAEHVVQTILQEKSGLSWAVVLPGLWGSGEIAEQLATAADVLLVDGSLSDDTPGSALSVGLNTAGVLVEHDVESALVRWTQETRARQGDELPIILLEAPELLDESSIAWLDSLLVTRSARVVAFVPSVEGMPGFLRGFRNSGRLEMLLQPPMTARELDKALRHYLAAAVSPTVLHRMTSLCGGHTVLAEYVLTCAQRAGVLSSDGGPWFWAPDESRFELELGRESSRFLGGFNAAERELLILTAVAGRLPEPWAFEYFGEATVRSLRVQRILGVDNDSAQGFFDLMVTAEALQTMILSDMREAEVVRLWYAFGRKIPPQSGGASSFAALTRWRARAEGVVDAPSAAQAAQWGIAHTAYQLVIDVVDSTDSACPALQVLAARAHYALGDTRSALSILESVSRTPGPLDLGTLRSAVLVAERIAIFHPEAASPVNASLRKLDSQQLTPDLDSVRRWNEETGAAGAARVILEIQHSAHDEEAAVARLWLGARLGLRQHTNFGRLVISSLLDDLTHEGGYPDVEDSALALLMLITVSHGWRTDVLRVNVTIWNGRVVHRPAVPAVADIVAAAIAMQQDRMAAAFHHASSAVRTFELGDPFGMLAFASSIAAATSSYVAEGLARRAHEEHWRKFGTGAVHEGLMSTRLLSEGMAAVGSGLPASDVTSRLLALAALARDRGEWAQEQQLLLLALLGHSLDAAQVVLEAPWAEERGRARMIVLLAQAMTAGSPEESVDIAELLLEADAAFFGLSILAFLWMQREEVSRQTQVRIVRAVLAARRRTDEASMLLSLFSDLELDLREARILRGLHQGLPSQEIASRLHVSPRTVEAAISAMLRRFSCANRMELLALDLLRD